jgi:pyroglutamyl-peptidase
MKTLLTGFGPFESIVDNPSSRIIRHFEAEGAPGHDLTTVVLPVSFQRADEEITRLLLEGRYDAALLLGVAGRDERIRLEACGRNVNRAGRPDVDGHLPDGEPIRHNAPDLFRAHFAVQQFVESLEVSGVPAYVSEDAGGYVCNRVYYAALHTIDLHALPTRCVFVHVPPDEQTFATSDTSEPQRTFLPMARQICAVEVVLRKLLE